MKRNSRIAAFLIFLSLVVPTTFPLFAQTTGAPSEIRMLNGLRVLVFKTPDPSVTVRLRIHAGASFDMVGKDGTMRLLTEILFPSEEFRNFIKEEFGKELVLRTNYDFIEIETGASPDRIISLLETLSARLISPEINAETTAIAKSLATASEATNENSAINQQVAGRFLGTHPHGRPINGSTESFSRIDFADIIQARNRFLSPDNATLVISGDVDDGLMSRATKRLFGPWTRADQKPRWSFAAPAPPTTPSDVVPYPGMEDETFAFRLAVRNIPRTDSRFPAYLVARSILDQRLRNHFGNSTVEDRGHRVQGALILGANSTDKNRVKLFDESLFADVSVPEFEVALSQGLPSYASIVDRWLDAETYSLSSPNSESEVASKLTVGDINGVLKALREYPRMLLTFGGTKPVSESGQ